MDKDLFEKMKQLLDEVEKELDPLKVFKITYLVKPKSSELTLALNSEGVGYLSATCGISKHELESIIKKHLSEPLKKLGSETEEIRATKFCDKLFENEDKNKKDVS